MSEPLRLNIGGHDIVVTVREDVVLLQLNLGIFGWTTAIIPWPQWRQIEDYVGSRHS